MNWLHRIRHGFIIRQMKNKLKSSARETGNGKGQQANALRAGARKRVSEMQTNKKRVSHTKQTHVVLFVQTI